MRSILFGFSCCPLRARNPLVATGVTGALQQGFCWGLNLLRVLLLVASFCMSDFEKRSEVGFCLVYVRDSVSSFVFLFDYYKGQLFQWLVALFSGFSI